MTSAGASQAGWIWQSPVGPNTESYGAANALDQYPTAAGQTLTWDARGNLSAWGALSFGHDSANRLLSASRSASPTFSATYTYDAVDRRVARAGSGTGVAAVRFVHAGEEEIAEWDPAANTVLRRYVPGPAIDQPVAYIEHVGGTQTFFYHQDRLGNIIATASASGALADRYVYTPYGVEQPLVATGQPLRYNARRYDPESGLYHYRARFYAPALGRFLQTDPVGYAGGLNLYAYVRNDPLNAMDPDGRLTCRVRGPKCDTVLRDGRFAEARLRDASRRFGALATALRTGRFNEETRATREAFVNAYGADKLTARNVTAEANFAAQAADWLASDATIVTFGNNRGLIAQAPSRNSLIIHPGYFAEGKRIRDGVERRGTLVHESAHGIGMRNDYFDFDYEGSTYSPYGAVGLLAYQNFARGTDRILSIADAFRCAVDPVSGDCP